MWGRSSVSFGRSGVSSESRALDLLGAAAGGDRDLPLRRLRRPRLGALGRRQLRRVGAALGERVDRRAARRRRVVVVVVVGVVVGVVVFVVVVVVFAVAVGVVVVVSLA